MIKKLKIKFLLTIMFFVTAIILSLVTVIAVVPVQREKREAEIFLEMIIDTPEQLQEESGRDMPREPKPMQRPEPIKDGENNRFSVSNIVTAQLDDEMNIVSWFSDRQDLYDEEYIRETALRVCESGDEFGTVDGQYYMIRKSSSGYSFALIDNGVAISNARRTLLLAVASGMGAWILLFVLAFMLVDRMTKPVTQAFEKQKQFVADAGHELKTPIAVISANVNVLEGETGENKWLSYIKTEAERMNGLVKNLMLLAQMEDSSKTVTHTEFDMSKAVMRAGLPFESLAFEKGTVIRFDVQPDIKLNGNEEQIEQLAAILLSNAVKYGNEKGIISLSLTRERKKITLSVYNTGQGISEDEKIKIFDRFYRVDKARSRSSGSYGLGLAIAKTIADENGGRISVESEYGKWVRFDVVF